MARASRRRTSPTRSRLYPGLCGQRAGSQRHGSHHCGGTVFSEIPKRLIVDAHGRLRPGLLGFAFLVSAGFLSADEGPIESLKAVRVWPAQDYTRVTLESDKPLRHSLLTVRNPERLVLDLKAEVKPQIFTLAPIGEYRHRLVLDIYPVDPLDPLLALLQEKPEFGTGQPSGKSVEPMRPEEKAEPKPPKSPRHRPVPAISRQITIVIDAGHGGEDPGARGRRGTYEKTVTLTIARKLKTLIDAEPNMRALLTRDGDYYIPLEMRVDKARRVKADLLVSVHADAFIKPHVRGATSTAAQWLAKRENDADLIGGVNLDRKDRYLAMTLADLTLTAQISDSLKLGRSVLGELGGVNFLHKGSVEQGGFAVLKAPDIPSILVETAFISNPDEERRLNDVAYQEKISRAILRGIKNYVAKNPPLSRSTLASIR